MTTYVDASYTPEYTANNPVIGWNSACLRGAIAVSSEADGYFGSNAKNPNTYNYWRPTALPATFELTVPVAEEINYCGIAAHNLGSTQCTVNFQVFKDGAWVTLSAQSPSDDSVILFLTGTETVTQARLHISGLLAPTIGHIAFGKALELPRRTYQGYTPIDMAQQSVFDVNVTRLGHVAGRSIRYGNTSNQFTVQNIPESWVRANFMDFMKEAVLRPFYLAERPQDYPDAVDYMNTASDIRPVRTGPKNFMSITL